VTSEDQNTGEELPLEKLSLEGSSPERPSGEKLDADFG